MKLPKLVLASGSPRRAEILESVGWEFEKRSADVDETVLKDESAEDYVRRLAYLKARRVADSTTGAIVLGADTTVVLDGKIIGKPVDLSGAREMVGALSGCWHDVITGVALIDTTRDRGDGARNGIEKLAENSIVGSRTTSVKFFELSDSEIEYLVVNGDPLDKAGAYAVQAQAALFIEEIRGDYWNVVGLPISLVYKLANDLV